MICLPAKARECLLVEKPLMETAMAAKKFTFKREPKETGLAAVGSPHASVRIKLNGEVVGRISAPTWSTKDNKWGVGFTVDDAKRVCNWKWVFLKARFDDEDAARKFVNDNFELLIQWKLHPLDY